MYKAYSNTNYARALLVILFAFVLKNSDAKTEHSKPTTRTLAILTCPPNADPRKK